MSSFGEQCDSCMESHTSFECIFRFSILSDSHVIRRDSFHRSFSIVQYLLSTHCSQKDKPRLRQIQDTLRHPVPRPFQLATLSGYSDSGCNSLYCAFEVVLGLEYSHSS